MNTDRTHNRTVIITGAGSGLGEATACTFAQDGFNVACLDINEQAAQNVANRLNENGAKAIAIRCDVSKEDDVFSAVQKTFDTFQRIDVVVNCAAVDHTLSVSDMTIAQWDQVISVNLRGPFLMAKAVLPIMKSQKYGHIVNIASTAATRAWANAAAYHASKWGLRGFSRALGVEGRPDNIRVTNVIPGGMKTHFFDRFVEQGIPMPDPANLQDPANVAKVILFAVNMPEESCMQEVIVTPLTETSWP